MGAQDGHLDFHIAPRAWGWDCNICLSSTVTTRPISTSQWIAWTITTSPPFCCLGFGGVSATTVLVSHKFWGMMSAEVGINCLNLLVLQFIGQLLLKPLRTPYSRCRSREIIMFGLCGNWVLNLKQQFQDTTSPPAAEIYLLCTAHFYPSTRADYLTG